jgi:hypothetical protein
VANPRLLGVEYFIKALCTGERTAAERLVSHLAADVEFDTNSQPGVPPIGRESFTGRDVVLARVSGQWPATPGFGRLGWADPEMDGDEVKVRSSSAVNLTFTFNDADEIQRVHLDGGWGSGATPPPPVTGTVDEIPLALRGVINNARANQTPMTVTYVDGECVPHTSFRGSVCVPAPTQLAIWVRDANGGLPKAIVSNPAVTLVYSDLRGSNMINVSGRASIVSDDETRRKVYELGPEVEQTHDVERNGVAVVIDVTNLQSFTNGGAVTMRRD